MTTPVRVQVDGASLNVHVQGDGMPVLLVHGFPLDHTQWEHQLARPNGWRWIAPDLRGAGASETPPDQSYAMARYADDLAAILDAVEADRPVCCGFSMGGYVLFELWRRHRGRIRALVLCDTKAEADTPDGRRARDEMVEVARREGPAGVARRVLPNLLGETTRATRPVLVERVRTTILRAPVAGIIGALQAMRDRRDASDLLAGIDVPALVVCGVEDVLTPPEVMQQMSGRIPGARYEEISRAGHLSPLEQPDQVNRALETFLHEL